MWLMKVEFLTNEVFDLFFLGFLSYNCPLVNSFVKVVVVPVVVRTCGYNSSVALKYVEARFIHYLWYHGTK